MTFINKNNKQLAVLSYSFSMYGRQAFAVAGWMTWNALATQLHLDVTTDACG